MWAARSSVRLRSRAHQTVAESRAGSFPEAAGDPDQSALEALSSVAQSSAPEPSPARSTAAAHPDEPRPAVESADVRGRVAARRSAELTLATSS
jgi:hypothetical protein